MLYKWPFFFWSTWARVGRLYASLWPSNCSRMFVTTLRMIVSRYRRVSECVRAPLMTWTVLERRSRPIRAPGSCREPTRASGYPSCLTKWRNTQEVPGELKAAPCQSVGCRPATNASPSHKRVRTSQETLRYRLAIILEH